MAATTREDIDRVAVTAGAELAAPTGAATLYDGDGRVLTTTLADGSGVPRAGHATVLDVATRRAEPSALVVAAEHELAGGRPGVAEHPGHAVPASSSWRRWTGSGQI